MYIAHTACPRDPLWERGSNGHPGFQGFVDSLFLQENIFMNTPRVDVATTLNAPAISPVNEMGMM